VREKLDARRLQGAADFSQETHREPYLVIVTVDDRVQRAQY
jgi:hypothetical protein